MVLKMGSKDKRESIVIDLLLNDEKTDELLSALDSAAKYENSYEYGLPLHDDGAKELLRRVVHTWVAKL